ncbi:MAG: hypothetical protein K2H36_05595, partial [Clostridia bacterium]|nr:hypothetical protein [Clostridia bacterium]
MKKRLLVMTVLAIMLLTMSMAMFGGCVGEEPEPREVELELFNPNTGGTVNRYDTLDIPEDGTPIYVRVKDKETGEILTDDDLPENTIRRSYTLVFYAYKEEREEIDSWNPQGYWPTKEELAKWPINTADYYEIRINFDCRPDNLKDPKSFVRKYNRKT